MHEIVVSFDVGGTNSRARIATLAGGGATTPVGADIAARGASASEFYDFVSRVVEAATAHGTVVSAVVAMAGMVDGDCGNITNWPSDTLVEVSRLSGCGLPLGRTSLVNDVVAGVWGAWARVDAGTSTVLPGRAGSGDRTAPELGAGNIVYLAPGTGLGTAGLVRHGLGSLGASTVACETQHVPMPRLGGEIAQIVDILESTLGRPLDWEDLISGRGLVHIYEAQRSIAAAMSPVGAVGDALGAEAIALAARAGDTLALAAVDAFYRTLGHYAQMLALTFLPCAAVVIGGATTEHNLALLQRGAFAEAFAAHRHFGDALGVIPVHTVGGEVNLEGGIWLAAHA